MKTEIIGSTDEVKRLNNKFRKSTKDLEEIREIISNLKTQLEEGKRNHFQFEDRTWGSQDNRGSIEESIDWERIFIP